MYGLIFIFAMSLLMGDASLNTEQAYVDVVLYQSRHDGYRNIYAIEPVSGQKVQITSHTSHDAYPHWSSRREEFIFSSERNGWWQLWSLPADTDKTARQLTGPGSWNAYAKWSPDGEQVVFASGRDGKPNIYIMNADGAMQAAAAKTDAADNFPAWSPDGSMVAFSSSRNGALELFIMDTRKWDAVPVTGKPVPGSFPNWSPDGEELVYVSHDTNGKGDISILNLGTGAVSRVIASNEDKNWPTWSPDGGQLAFSLMRDGDWDLFLFDIASQKMIPLVQQPGLDGQASWARLSEEVWQELKISKGR